MENSTRLHKEIEIDQFFNYITKSDKCLLLYKYLYSKKIALNRDNFENQIERIFRNEKVPFHELMDLLKFLNYNVYCQVKNKPYIDGEIILFGVCKDRVFYIETINNLLLTDSFFRLRFTDYLEEFYSTNFSGSLSGKDFVSANNLAEHYKNLSSFALFNSLLADFELKSKQSQLLILSDIKKLFEFNQIVNLGHLSEFRGGLTREDFFDFFAIDRLFNIIKDLENVKNYEVTDLNSAIPFVFDIFYPDYIDIQFIFSPSVDNYFSQIEIILDLLYRLGTEYDNGIVSSIEDEIIRKTDVRYFFDLYHGEVLNVKYTTLKDFNFEVVDDYYEVISKGRILDVIRYFFHFDEYNKKCALNYISRIIEATVESDYFVEEFCLIQQKKFDVKSPQYFDQRIFLKEVVYSFFQMCLKQESSELKHIIQPLIIAFSRNVMNVAFDYEQFNDREISNLVNTVYSAPQNHEQLVNTLRKIYKYTLKYGHVTEEALEKVATITPEVGNVKYAIDIVNRSVRNATNKGLLVLSAEDIFFSN